MVPTQGITWLFSCPDIIPNNINLMQERRWKLCHIYHHQLCKRSSGWTCSHTWKIMDHTNEFIYFWTDSCHRNDFTGIWNCAGRFITEIPWSKSESQWIFNISRWCNHYICKRNPESDYRLRKSGNKKKRKGRCRPERSRTVPIKTGGV